jgi:DNA-directed RNA polymerase subunit RPC12/RpoP
MRKIDCIYFLEVPDRNPDSLPQCSNDKVKCVLWPNRWSHATGWPYKMCYELIGKDRHCHGKVCVNKEDTENNEYGVKCSKCGSKNLDITDNDDLICADCGEVVIKE